MKKNIYMCFALAICFLIITAGTASAGESPSEVYSKYHSAFKSGNFNLMLTFVCKKGVEEMKKMPQEHQNEMLKTIQTIMPETYTVDEEKIENSKATLKLKALMMSPATGKTEPHRGNVSMIKEENGWKVEFEDWSQQQ